MKKLKQSRKNPVKRELHRRDKLTQLPPCMQVENYLPCLKIDTYFNLLLVTRACCALINELTKNRNSHCWIRSYTCVLFGRILLFPQQSSQVLERVILISRQTLVYKRLQLKTCNPNEIDISLGYPTFLRARLAVSKFKE